MNLKEKAKNKTKKTIKKVAFKVIKPFLPFILIIGLLFFAICSIIDAIFIQEVQTDDTSMTPEQLEFKNMCIEKSEYLNTCHNYKNGEITHYLLDVDDRENDKLLEWSHLYSIMAFCNMSNGSEMDAILLNEVSKYFESTFTYETNTITTETTTEDEDGNKTVSKEEQTQYILVESDSIIRSL